jgi:delta 1-pyrroline-5-carboxylate dehydrogenase
MQQSLATLLKQAATEPGMRPAFFELLLASDVWLPQGEQLAIATNDIDIIHWQRADGSKIVPFFTDESALQQACGQHQAAIQIPAKQLLAITQGEILYLNPELPEGKLFTVEEVNQLLQHQAATLVSYQVIDHNQSLQISVVAEPPEQLVQSLQQLFSTHNSVRQAFLANFRENDEQTMKLMVALELDADAPRTTIIQQTGNVAIDVLLEHQEVDVCVIDPAMAGLSHLLIAHFTPFYQRRWGSFLRDIQSQPLDN